MLIVQKVCLAELRVVKGQNKVIPMVLIVLVEVVAHHQRVCFTIPRELLPHCSEVPGITIEGLISSALEFDLPIFVKHHEKKSKVSSKRGHVHTVPLTRYKSGRKHASP